MRSRTSPAHSVKDVLSRAGPGLTRVTEQARRQNFWHSWLGERLPAEILTRISGLAEQRGTLVVFAEGPAWGPRVRYAVLELEAEIRAAAGAAVTRVEVRVLPRNSPRSR
jgi:Dna[CI] antecedent, DciA